ncbi:MAG: hypothetical protein Solivirus3_30 [Solivirus sp.]|uniref:Uncharacterized protein n=1 Tax=Solivirus sp. TaxID=2487772 RepID=A0A3G5AFR8_9VIRU|nr:MAG: hypothetical protein Solivirus3_30 [Solivirus sp.]
MKFRTGDVIIWSATREYDLLGHYTIGLGGWHTAIILVGKSFEQFSKCKPTPSPTDTYVTFQITSIYPIEEIVGHLWTKPNSCSLYILKRSKREADIPEKLAYDTYIKYLSFEKVGETRRVRLAILAYLKMGYLDEDPVKNNINYNLCPWFVGFMLASFGILSKRIDINSLLPIDFFNLEFGQKQKYRKIEVFDKLLMDFRIGYLSFLEHTGLIEFQSHENESVDEIIGDYQFPQFTGSLR